MELFPLGNMRKDKTEIKLNKKLSFNLRLFQPGSWQQRRLRFPPRSEVCYYVMICYVCENEGMRIHILMRLHI
jgi:hypothetical protein